MSGWAINIQPVGVVGMIAADEVDMDFLQAQVGGYFTPVTTGFLPEDRKPPIPVSMYVDEDGLEKELRVNPLASLLGMTPLVGPMVIVKQDGYDDAPLTSDEMNTVLQWVMRVVAEAEDA